MASRVFWVNEPRYATLAIMPRPRGGSLLAEEIDSLKGQGVDVLASLLTDEEIEEADLKQEADLCARKGIEFLSFPIHDRDVPPRDTYFLGFFRSLLEHLSEGKRVVIHCWAGIGRSGLIATCLLVVNDMPFDAAICALSSARGWPIPDTEEQLKWAADFAEAYRRGKQA